jgi:predicted lipoprotein with Yx(FWY)xxD motif
LHRAGNKPAVERADGYRFWYKDGKLHRAGDKPAIEYADGTRAWYKNGKEYTPRSK